MKKDLGFIDICLAFGVPEQAAERIWKAYQAAVAAEEKKKNPVNAFIARYCEVFKVRYGINPVVDGRAAGVARQMVKSLGVDKACKLVECYLTMRDTFFAQKRHDLVTFSMNLNSIAVYAETGAGFNQTQARATEKADHAKDQMRRINEGLL